MSHYKRDQIRAIAAIIADDLNNGKQSGYSAQRVNELGHKKANGTAWKTADISYFKGQFRNAIRQCGLSSAVLFNNRPKKRIKHGLPLAVQSKPIPQAKPLVAAVKGGLSSDTLTAILTDPAMTDQQRIKVLIAACT